MVTKFQKKKRSDEGLRLEASRRMEFIEFRLYWEGRVNRGDLTDFFQISIPQASNDLSKYQEIAPGNIEYDRSGKFYFATEEFTPVFYMPTSDDYLGELKQVASGAVEPNESKIKTIPSNYLIPVLERPVPKDNLKKVINSIKSRKDINILYQSMSRKDPAWRWIAPQAIAYDGFRWHVRAYCFTRKRFIDFALGRIWEIDGNRPSEIGDNEDRAWNNVVNLKIGPNPAFSDKQKKVIEMEYGMNGGLKEVTVRESFLPYFLKRYGLDHHPSHDAQKQQIILLNREDLPETYKPIGSQ